MINFAKISDGLKDQLNKSLMDTKKFKVILSIQEAARTGSVVAKFTRHTIDELSNQDWILQIKEF